MAATVTNSAPCAATYARSSLIAFVIWFSTVFSDTSNFSAISRYFNPWSLASKKTSLHLEGRVSNAESNISWSVLPSSGVHPAYNLQKPDDHLSTPYLPYASAEGYATVPHGSSHIGSKLLLRHVIQSFVPYADKQFLHNIFRVVLVRNISIGYTAQPWIMFLKPGFEYVLSIGSHYHDSVNTNNQNFKLTPAVKKPLFPIRLLQNRQSGHFLPSRQLGFTW